MEIKDNDHRNNILIDLNRIGFFTNEAGVKIFGYVDEDHPDFRKGIKRMPIQVTELDCRAIEYVIRYQFKDYFEKIYFEPPFDPHTHYFKGIKRIGKDYFAIHDRIMIDEINSYWKEVGDMDRYFNWMRERFLRWENNPN